jgi:hypothetical protein
MSFSLSNRIHELKIQMPTRYPQQLGDSRGSSCCIDTQTEISLKFSQCMCGEIAKDTVDPSCIKAQRTEATLELRHIITAHHWVSSVEQAIPEAQTSFDERAPGGFTHDAIDSEASKALKLLNSGAGRWSEAPGLISERCGNAGSQPCLKVDDSLAHASLGKGQGPVAHARWALISWSS